MSAFRRSATPERYVRHRPVPGFRRALERPKYGASLGGELERFDYLVALREKVAAEISGVRDSEFSLWWDDSRSNWLTRPRLWNVYRQACEGAEAFGIYIVGRHGICGSRSHRPEYIMAPLAGRSIEYRDPEFTWEYFISQGFEESPCPCTGSKRDKRHYVIYDVLFDKAADQRFCRSLQSILSDLHEAAERSGDKKPRSGIREHLLRALITINDHVLPQTVSAYIAERTAEQLGSA